MADSKTSIKAVVFDLGKVLVDFDYSIAIRRIAARGRLTVEALGHLIGAVPLMLEYERGKLSTREFFTQVCEQTGYCGSLGEFANHFGDIFSPIQPMVELHQALTARGLPTFIFSNTNELAIRHIRCNFPFFSRFTGYLFSYEHHYLKPEPEFYEALERQSGCCGAEILYLDDRPENVQTGLERKWHALVHNTPEQTIRYIQELGLLDRADLIS